MNIANHEPKAKIVIFILQLSILVFYLFCAQQFELNGDNNYIIILMNNGSQLSTLILLSSLYQFPLATNKLSDLREFSI